MNFSSSTTNRLVSPRGREQIFFWNHICGESSPLLSCNEGWLKICEARPDEVHVLDKGGSAEVHVSVEGRVFEAGVLDEGRIFEVGVSGKDCLPKVRILSEGYFPEVCATVEFGRREISFFNREVI